MVEARLDVRAAHPSILDLGIRMVARPNCDKLAKHGNLNAFEHFVEYLSY